MPAKAGIQSAWHQIFWIPAFAGMTVTDRINSPTAQIFNIQDVADGLSGRGLFDWNNIAAFGEI
jgi:hypothetical protein